LACTVEAIAIVCSIVLTLVFRQILKRENRKLDLKEQEAESRGDGSGTEKFRYIY
jgi:hypothetical protein